MRPISLYSHVLFAALVPFAIVACGMSSDDSRNENNDLDEQETIIRPDGSDMPGKFKFVAPPGYPSTSTVTIDSTLNGEIGQEIGPLAVGRTYSFGLKSVPLAMRGTTPATGSNQVVTTRGALLSFHNKGVPQPTLGLTSMAGLRSPGVAVYRWDESNNTWTDVLLGTSARPADWLEYDGTKPAAVLPGKYLVAFGISDGQIVEIAADGSKVVKAWDYATRRVANVRAPIRELPTAPCALASGRTVPAYAFDTGNDAFVLTDGALSAEVGARSETTHAGENLTISGVTGKFVLPFGVVGQGARTLQIGRLDVEDVAVQQPDGTTKMVRGTYRVYPKTGTNSSGQDVFSSTSVICRESSASYTKTHTGFDLPRARYKVVVEYSTVEAGTKQDVHVVDVE